MIFETLSAKEGMTSNGQFNWSCLQNWNGQRLQSKIDTIHQPNLHSFFILLIQPCFVHGKNLTLFLPANRGCPL